jgi:hypothetical protein
LPICAICSYLLETPRSATGTVGLLTAVPSLVNAAVDRFVMAGPEQHVVVNACPEHVVDVYRGRIDGVKMAWRLAGEDETPTLPRRNPAATSASPA